jgi:hypothetical protein
MIALRTLLLVLGLALSIPALASVDVEKIAEDSSGSTLFFKRNGKDLLSLRVPLYEVRVLRELEVAEAGTPLHLLVSARPCKACPEEASLFLVRGDGKKPMHFVTPGRILDPKTRAVLLESRAFYGRCLPDADQEAYIVFQNERVDRRRHLQASVYIAEPGREFVRERLIEKRAPRIDRTLRRVKAKECFEVSGRNRLMLAKPLDLTPRRGLTPGGDDEGDDAEETTKENQTQQDLPSPDES